MMIKKIFLIIILLQAGLNSAGQDWSFVKEKDGIKLYTRKEAGDALKSFKGVMDIRSTVEKVAGLISDVKNNDWWDENLSEVKVLRAEGPAHFQYYLVYDLSWPLSDRDLAVDARVSVDPGKEMYTINAKSLSGVVPEKQGLVRIRDYWQRWIVQAIGNGMVRVTLEGSANPGGNLPAWLVNSVILDTPYKILRTVREKTGT